MKNTLQKSKFRILIYKGSEGYVSICYETGFVDVNDTIQEAQKHMNDGIIALLKTIKSGELTVKAINQKPQLKYRILFYLLRSRILSYSLQKRTKTLNFEMKL